MFGQRTQGRTIRGGTPCIMYYTYYIILCINTGRIISRHNTGVIPDLPNPRYFWGTCVGAYVVPTYLVSLLRNFGSPRAASITHITTIS